MDWKLSDDRPIWLQLSEQLARRIVAGQYPPGGKLPSVRELAPYAGANPNTMQRPLSQLESDPLAIANRTAGRTVTEDQEVIAQVRHRMARQVIQDFLSAIEELGYTRADAMTLLQQEEESSYE